MPVNQRGPLLTILIEKDLLSENCEFMAAELALLIMVSHCGRMLTSPFADAYEIARQRSCRILGIVEGLWERKILIPGCAMILLDQTNHLLFTWDILAAL